MLTPPFLKSLSTKAHQLRPVVMIGAKGLTDTVHQEIEAALLAHELIKIKISSDTREERRAMIDTIVQHHKAVNVQQIGHIVVIYREKED